MEFLDYLKEQMRLHPSMERADVVKLCAEAAYGPPHIWDKMVIDDYLDMKDWLRRDLDKAAWGGVPLYEQIGPDMYRVNLAGWKGHGLPSRWLYNMFIGSGRCIKREAGLERMVEYLQAARELYPGEKGPGDHLLEDREFLEEYGDGICNISHSKAYQEAEMPNYRVVHREYVRLIPVLEKMIRIIGSKGECVVAIDGPTGAEQNTLAMYLADTVDGKIIPMEDFYLPMGWLTPERQEKIGGCVRQSRARLVLGGLTEREEPTSYDVFDRVTMEQSTKTVEPSKAYIAAGPYACWSALGNYADVSVFTDVTAQEQERYIRAQGGEALWEMYRDVWLPMEERYLTETGLKDKVDFTL